MPIATRLFQVAVTGALVLLGLSAVSPEHFDALSSALPLRRLLRAPIEWTGLAAAFGLWVARFYRIGSPRRRYLRGAALRRALEKAEADHKSTFVSQKRRGHPIVRQLSFGASDTDRCMADGQ